MSSAETLKAHYPDAKDGKELTHEILTKLQAEHNVNPEHVLLATSICSDELNVLSTTFADNVIGPFTMGGLAGMPFGGKTAMTAFAHHVPEDGTAMILYGPHVGINSDGHIGRVWRIGQKSDSTCCGALMVALNRMKNNAPSAPIDDEDDLQQALLEKALLPHKERILQANNAVKEITDVTYEEIHARMERLLTAVKGELQCARIVLLGGVLINHDPDVNDWVDVRHFDVIELQ